MKLYSYANAPTPRRVLLYIAEKGIEVEIAEVNLREAEQHQDSFRKINPMCSVPVLQLDNGEFLTESYAIMDYLEALQPQPNMLGETAIEKGRIREMDSLIMFSMLSRVARIFRNESEMFKQRIEQFPALAAMERKALPGVLKIIQDKMGEFAVGDKPSMADCTLFAVCTFAMEAAGLDIFADAPRLGDWFKRFAARPSVNFGR